MEIPFEDNSLDAIYAIEATCHAPTFEGVYGEAFRVLKPGAKFGCYEWCMTDSYDESNPEHRRIAHGIEVKREKEIKVKGQGINKVSLFLIARKRHSQDAPDCRVPPGSEERWF